MNMKRFVVSILLMEAVLLPLLPIISSCPFWMKVLSVIYVCIIYAYRKSRIAQKFIDFELTEVQWIETFLSK